MAERATHEATVPTPTNDNQRNVAEPLGFRNLLGMRIVEWKQDTTVIELTVGEQHLNRNGTVHGGVLTSMLDTALSLAGLYCPDPAQERKGMTLSLTTTFLAPAREGILRAVGQRCGGGRTIYMARGEVLDADGNILAMGEGSFRERSAGSVAAG